MIFGLLRENLIKTEIFMKMKSYIFFALSLFVFTVINSNVEAQDTLSKYGNDSITCVRNLSLYKEFERQDNYVDALKPWRYCFNNCPMSTKNLFIDGVKIMYYYIGLEKNEVIKQKYVDTLIMVYEKRIEYYNQEGFVWGRLGVDLLRYRVDSVSQAYKYLSKSVDDQKINTEDAVGVTYMQSSVYLYKAGELSKSELVDNFFKINKIFADRLESLISAGKPEKYVEKTKTAIESIDNHFMNSGAADCNVLIPYFEPKFNQSPGDLELLKNITNLLSNATCDDSELYFMAIKQRYKIEPSAEAAYLVAKQALKREQFTESAKYYLEAIEKQSDPIEKSDYYYELGVITYSQLADPVKAREYAYKSIELNKNSGKPYILIGNIYASSSKSCGENDFERNAVYWVAVDKFVKAKSVDSEVADMAEKLISTYSKYFPNKENAFFYNVHEGDTYTVGCWINEKTIVRFNN